MAWRLGDFNVRERHLCFVCEESGNIVVEGAASWWRGRLRGGGGGGVEEKAVRLEVEDFNVREREREEFVI